MSEFKTSLLGKNSSPNIRTTVLARVYAEILSWEIPGDSEPHPDSNSDGLWIASNLDGSVARGIELSSRVRVFCAGARQLYP